MKKRHLKPWTFYAFLFLASFLILGAYTLYRYFTSTVEIGDIWNLIVLPILFTGMYLLGDYVMQKITDKRKKINYEELYLEAIGGRMAESKQFLIEDFRRLKENSKFQAALKYGYFIIQNGESDKISIAHLEKKFDQRTLEGKALPFIVDYVREKTVEKQK
ncbi:MAG: hypothetical protein V1761_00530 [bacterium]